MRICQEFAIRNTVLTERKHLRVNLLKFMKTLTVKVLRTNTKKSLLQNKNVVPVEKADTCHKQVIREPCENLKPGKRRFQKYFKKDEKNIISSQMQEKMVKYWAETRYLNFSLRAQDIKANLFISDLKKKMSE